MQVYLILDEFILGGEFEETSKKVILLTQWLLQQTVARSPGHILKPACCSTILCLLTSALSPTLLDCAAGCPAHHQVILDRLKELDSIDT